MNEPILPDLPEGFYLATGDGEGSRVYERCNGKWTNEYGVRCEDPRSLPWNSYTLHSIPALLSAAGERDALKVRMDEALAVLTELSSRYDNDLGINVCAICGSEVGHSPGCSLAAVLAKAKS